MSKRSSPAGYTPAVDVGPLCAAFVGCFVDRHARWDNGACGSSNGSSAPTFSRQFRASRASIACTTPRAGCSTSARRAISGGGWPSTVRRAGQRNRKRRTLVRSADRIEWQVCASLFSDQSESRSGYPEFPNFWEYPSATDRGSVGHSGGQVRCACARDGNLRRDFRLHRGRVQPPPSASTLHSLSPIAHEKRERSSVGSRKR